MNVRGIATGIGSLPFKDPEQALELIFNSVGQAPFWPQLPKRNAREGMVAQFSENLPGFRVTDDGLEFDAEQAEEGLEKFYEHILSMDLGYFRISESYAAGLHAFAAALKNRSLSHVEFIKCHVTGPFTFAAGIKNSSGTAVVHDEVLMQAMSKGLLMKALWQIDLFKRFGKPLIIFVDEPFLSGFGSAYTALTRETAVRALDEFCQPLKSQGALVGVHCCGNTDWSIFTEIKAIDIINFDAFGYLDKLCLYSRDLSAFFGRGGLLCWGIVPTQDFRDTITLDQLREKVDSGIDAMVKKGISRAQAEEQLLLSPSCGLGTLDAAASNKIFSLLSGLSANIRKAK
ncbi:MAG: hypothetical protein MUC52_00405 [Candidatus Omnitrophica bacterium]|jgi:methionine synthase II (cobalamin-independent)|nr:hypothetical protein [Candidatus Omnitrophota bacterium]